MGIVYPSDVTATKPSFSSYILVSCGAKVLRIKKKSFTSLLTKDAQLHARTLATQTA